MNVTLAKNERGAWCVYIDGCLISDHATYDGAVAVYRTHVAVPVSDSEDLILP